MQNNYNSRDVEYAGFWVRLAAYCIDSIIVFAGLLVVRLLMAGVSSLLEGSILDGGILFHYTLKDIVLYIFQVLYFILCTYYTGTTLGKKALNLRVVPADQGDSADDAEGDQRLTFLDIVYRETVGRFLCSLSVGIGYLIVGIDKEKRGIHDMLSDTRVIYAKKIKVYPVYQAPMGQPLPPMRQQPPQAPVQPGNGSVPPTGQQAPQPPVQPGNGSVPPMRQQAPPPPVQPGNGSVPPTGQQPPRPPVQPGNGSVPPMGQQPPPPVQPGNGSVPPMRQQPPQQPVQPGNGSVPPTGQQPPQPPRPDHDRLHPQNSAYHLVTPDDEEK